MKENRQTKKGDRKQTKALPPFSSPPQLCANSGDTGASCKYTKLHQSPRIESFNPFPLLSFLQNIPPPPFCWPLVLLSSSSCQYRPKASDIVLAKSLLLSAVLPPCSSVALCHPALCATPKSWAKRRLLSPQQIRTLKKCPFVLLMHFFSPHLLLLVLRHPHLHFLKQPASVWLGSNHHKCKPTFHFN